MGTWFHVIVLCVVTCQAMHYTSFFAHRSRSKRNNFDCLPGAVSERQGIQVFLTVSSLTKTSRNAKSNVTSRRQLELNWFNGPALTEDVVALYDHDPVVDPTNPLEQTSPHRLSPQTYYRTSVVFPRPPLSDVKLERRCLGYWVGYLRQGHLIASNCLKIEPNWMWENRDYYAPIKLIDMMIPGTHDAGSYARQDDPQQTDNIFYRWILTQEEDFYSQLVYGIRHFDLRLAYYSETSEKFWVNHDIFRVNPFEEVIKACVKFLNSTKEILILDFHQFPVGFSNRPERHLQLINYVKKELGAFMLGPSAGYGVTMDAIWRSNRRLIVAYNNAAMTTGENLLWPGIPQLWAQTADINYLKVFMNSHMTSGRVDLWSAQLEFTPTALDIFSSTSLRIFADRVNRNVTEWCRDLWWDEANVVAVDFFLGTDIVQVAIEANQKRRSCIDHMIRTKG